MCPNAFLNAAEGYAALGMFQEAWEAVEAVPVALMTTLAGLKLRLYLCARLRHWEEGRRHADSINENHPLSFREAAGRFYGAEAEDSYRQGDLDGAEQLLWRMFTTWPELSLKGLGF